VQAPLLEERRPRARKRQKIDPFVPYLKERIGLGVLNARKLYGEIAARGYAGGESQVRAFVHTFRPPAAPPATVRFETAPGEQAQVDWGHFGAIWHEGRRRRLYALVMTLGWSRALYLEFTGAADLTWFLRGHQHAFAYVGGAPRQVVAAPGRGRARSWPRQVVAAPGRGRARSWPRQVVAAPGRA
jgi:transposase